MAPLSVDGDSILTRIIPGVLSFILIFLPEIYNNRNKLSSILSDAISLSDQGLSIIHLFIILAALIIFGKVIDYIRIRFSYVPNNFRQSAFQATDDPKTLGYLMRLNFEIAQILENSYTISAKTFNKIIDATIISQKFSESTNILTNFYSKNHYDPYNKEEIIQKIAKKYQDVRIDRPRDLYTHVVMGIAGKETKRLQEIRSVYITYKNVFIALFLSSFLRLVYLSCGYYIEDISFFTPENTQFWISMYIIILFLIIQMWSSIKSVPPFFDKDYTDQLIYEYILNDEMIDLLK